MKCPLISVIVPVYNSEQTINRCVNSILNQTFHDFELILVDDGSTDGSLGICSEMTKLHDNVRCIHQINQGVTKARSTGVFEAKGEWICFVDADDSLPPYSLEALLSGLNNKAEIVVGQINDKPQYPKHIELNRYRKLCIMGEIVHSGPVAKLFKRNLFDERIFDIPRNIIRGEDLIMNVRLSFKTKYAPVIVPQKIYNYLPNSNSVMSTTVHTVEHAELFLNYLQKSIPIEYQTTYLSSIIQNKIKALINIAYDNPADKAWKSSLLFQGMRSEMKLNNVRFTIGQWLMLHAWNRKSMSFAIKVNNFFQLL